MLRKIKNVLIKIVQKSVDNPKIFGKAKEEKRQMKKTQNEMRAGITLIALIITIIVLLILAGVSISLVVGDNGALTQTQRASTRTGESAVIDDVQLAWSAVMTKYYEDATNNANLDRDTYIDEARLIAAVQKNGQGTLSNFSKNAITGVITAKYTPNGKETAYDITIDMFGKVTILGSGTGSSSSTPTTPGGSILKKPRPRLHPWNISRGN